MKQLIKRCAVCCVLLLLLNHLYAQPNITRVEYYLDVDPGYNKATSVNITAGKNLSNLAVNLNTSNISNGVHLLGVRARDANGAWSLDNKWLFAKPYATDTTSAAPASKITRIEYYLDNDPGYGKATTVSFTKGVNLSNLTVNLDPSTLNNGVHLFCIRAKDSLGKWSLDNKWLFAKPFASDTTSPEPAPNFKQVEYYIDKDPGYGKGVPVAINNVNTLNDFSLPVNVSTLSIGNHKLFIRSKDVNGAWSLDNVFSFKINTAINGASIVVNSITKKTLCVKDSLSISYQASGTYNAGNVFNVQLSDAAGSFASPTVIGSFTGTKNSVINCALPSSLTDGTKYKIRVVSTNPAVTGVSSADSLSIHSLPAKPTVTPSGSVSFCSGDSLLLKASSGYSSYSWSSGQNTRNIYINLAGNYTVTGTSVFGCKATSAPVTASLYSKPAPTITSSGPVSNLCPGTIDTLTSSPAVSYLWNTSATTESITINTPGSYSVTVTDANGCKGTSTAVNVTYLACGKPTGLKVGTITGTSAAVSWNAMSCANNYNIQYRIAGTTTWSKGNSNKNSFTIKGLTPAATYEWRVRTACTGSNSAFTKGANFTTTASAAAEITVDEMKPVNDDSFDAMLFPNPTNNTATLRISGSRKPMSIIIADMTGKILWSTKDMNDAEIKLPVENLSAGIYIVTVNNGKQTRALKLIKD